jgi:hypothetical protein
MVKENNVALFAAVLKGSVADAKSAISNGSKPNKVTRAHFDLIFIQ